MPRIILATCLALFLLSPHNHASAESKPDAQRIIQLEAKIKLLEAKIAQHDAAEADTKDKASPEEQAPKPERPNRSKQRAEREDRPRSIRSVLDITKRMPPEIAANPKGKWTTPGAEQQALDYLKYAVWNTPYNGKLTVDKITVTPNPAAATDSAASPHEISITFKPNDHPLGDETIREKFEAFKFFGDDRLRNRVEKRLKPGNTIAVRGLVKTVDGGVNKDFIRLNRRDVFGVIPMTLKFKKLELPGVVK